MNREASPALIPLLDHRGTLSAERRAEAMILINMGFTAAELSILYFDDQGKRYATIMPSMVGEKS